MNRKTIPGITIILLLMFVMGIGIDIIAVKAQPIELYYDDGEADQGHGVIANTTFGEGVEFDHPEPGIAYRIQSVKFYIYREGGPLRLFVYSHRQSTSEYEKVYENVTHELSLGWNLIDLIPYNLVTYEDFVVGFNWVLNHTPYLGVDVDTESHSGWFETTNTTIFIRGSGFYNNMIRAYISPISSVTATVEVHPQALKLRSRSNWTTAYIELSEGYDVVDINVSSILMNDTIPVGVEDSTMIGDYDGDGISDLMVKFNRTMVSEFLLSKGIMYGNVTISTTGEVGGAPFEGTDIIKVLFPGDADDDGDCDRYDFGLFSLAYGASVGDPTYNWGADFNDDEKIDRYDFSILAEYYGKTAV